MKQSYLFSFLKNFFLSTPEDIFSLLFGERGGTHTHRQTHTQWERNTDLLPSHTCPDWELNCSLGLCPNWESNPWPFGLQDSAPINWATLARAKKLFVDNVWDTEIILSCFLVFHGLNGNKLVCDYGAGDRHVITRLKREQSC